jgi:phage-related protein
VLSFKRGAYTKTNNHTTVYLEDTYLNILHPIEDTDYNVNINQIGSDFDRFRLVFKSTLQEVEAGSNSPITTNVDEQTERFVNVYYHSGQLNIISNQNLNSKVIVYDLTGKQVLNNNNQYTNTTATIPLSAANGVYVVKLTEANGNSTTHRVVVN